VLIALSQNYIIMKKYITLLFIVTLSLTSLGQSSLQEIVNKSLMVRNDSLIIDDESLTMFAVFASNLYIDTVQMKEMFLERFISLPYFTKVGVINETDWNQTEKNANKILIGKILNQIQIKPQYDLEKNLSKLMTQKLTTPRKDYR
jgi:hypothetical protein